MKWATFGFGHMPTCPHSGTARSRARRRLLARLERLHTQLLTLNLRWHSACTLSCGGIGQDSPKEAVSTRRKTNRGRHEGSSRCSRNQPKDKPCFVMRQYFCFSSSA
jgi:hypothetical protein